MTSRTGWFLRSAVITALGALSFGCGGLGPGDYVVYRVAVTEEREGSSCPGADDPDNKSDSSSYLATGTFILYAGVEDTFYLDTGIATLEGTFAEDVYTFAGKSTDITYIQPGDVKITATDSTTITMTVDGAAVTGTASRKVSQKCDGANCPDDISCTTTSDFVGTEVEDVELDHNVN